MHDRGRPFQSVQVGARRTRVAAIGTPRTAFFAREYGVRKCFVLVLVIQQMFTFFVGVHDPSSIDRRAPIDRLVISATLSRTRTAMPATSGRTASFS
jgi:hypothetical protein